MNHAYTVLIFLSLLNPKIIAMNQKNRPSMQNFPRENTPLLIPNKQHIVYSFNCNPSFNCVAISSLVTIALIGSISMMYSNDQSNNQTTKPGLQQPLLSQASLYQPNTTSHKPTYKAPSYNVSNNNSRRIIRFTRTLLHKQKHRNNTKQH